MYQLKQFHWETYGTSEVYKDINLYGSLDWISMGLEDVTALGYSYGTTDGLKIGLDKGTLTCFLVGCFEGSIDIINDISLNGITMVQ